MVMRRNAFNNQKEMTISEKNTYHFFIFYFNSSHGEPAKEQPK